MLISSSHFVATAYVLVVTRGAERVVGFKVFEGSTGVLSKR